MRAFRLVVLAVVAVLLVGCASGGNAFDALSAISGPTTVPGSSAGGAGAATTLPPGPSAGGTTLPVLTTPTTSAGIQGLLSQAGDARQAIVVTSGSATATTANLTAFQRTGNIWTVVFGPWEARIGARGFAPPGEKREGDERTPSGSFGFDFFFGVSPNPGVKFPYRVVTQSIVWVDDPKSPLYNQWIDRNVQPVTASVEQMYQPQAYKHGAVIAYNTARTPGAGSAIFLHASTGSPTAGCVSLPVDQLVQVLTWLDPALNPRIVMGTG